MAPILIISSSKNNFKKWILKDINEKEKSSLNNLFNTDIRTFGEREEDLSTETLKSFLSMSNLKPSILKNNYLALYNFDRFNKTMQNNTLKTLEESKSQIYLNSTTDSVILSTVISRCKTIKLKKKISVNIKITSVLDKIIKEQDLSQVSKLSKVDEQKVLNNVEIYLKRRQNNFDKKTFKDTIDKLYQLKKQLKSNSGLNFELHFYNIIVSLLEKKTL